MLHKWSLDFLKKSLHTVSKIIEKPSWNFTCFKCTGEWIMSDKEGMQPIFERPHISCPHCGAKAKVIDK